jgi:hypothetical protein
MRGIACRNRSRVVAEDRARPCQPGWRRHSLAMTGRWTIPGARIITRAGRPFSLSL